ncbi:calcium-activated chloride channel regulator 1-like isoform X2 [Ptychodera flava]|uniref:calcium-activated chloride channel regulator 1-like isoform X2 n=1 Tax=Ptychodera flava TaxID=63121 RepID=UPI00396A04FD
MELGGLMSFFLVLSAWKLELATPTLTLDNNVYSGLVVAVHEDVTEDDQVIPRLKDALTKSSEFLYKATRQRAHFGEIVIVVPESWTSRAEYQIQTPLNYDDAHIIIEGPNPEYSNRPYVNHDGQCGQQGNFIHITPAYLLDDTYQDLYGDRGRYLTTQWATYRWGVFEEYPTAGVVDFYLSNVTGKVEATRCSLSITGTTLYIDDSVFPPIFRPCLIDPNTALYEEGCVFLIDAYQYATASLMYIQDLEGVDYFCDSDASSPHTLHNSEAPNRHNTLCNGRSVWDVMEDTIDFVGGRNPSRTAPSTLPEFKVIRNNSDVNVVLVLDISASTLPGETSMIARQVAAYYITEFLPNGTQAGVVAFSDLATEAAPLTTITGNETRELLLASLPDQVYGATSIGSGVMKGVQMLMNSSVSQLYKENSSGRLVVISNGEENQAPYISDVIDDVINNSVVVDMVKIPGGHDQALEDLVQISGGNVLSYSSLGMSTLEHIADPYKANLAYKSSTVANFTLSENSTYSGALTSHDRISIFEVRWSKCCRPVLVQLTTPSGQKITSSANSYHSSYSDRIVVIDTQSIDETGTWHYSVHNSLDQEQEINMLIKSGQNPQISKLVESNADLRGLQSDVTTPGRIVDLTVANVSNANDDVIVTLTWSATGDDIHNGTAKEYDLRISSNYSELFFNFSSGKRINDSSLLEGTLLSPKPSGTEETVKFQVQDHDLIHLGLFYVALVAVDYAGNLGERSNIVVVEVAASTTVEISTLPKTSTYSTTQHTTTLYPGSSDGTTAADASSFSISSMSLTSGTLKTTPSTTGAETDLPGDNEEQASSLSSVIVIAIAVLLSTAVVGAVIGLSIYLLVRHKSKPNEVFPKSEKSSTWIDDNNDTMRTVEDIGHI